MKPMDIEKQSFAIIESELTTDIPHIYKPIVKRVIHTTADFSYETSMTFSDGVVNKALNAIRSGVDIVTDTNMAKAGINKSGLKKLGTEAHCFMADTVVAAEAKARKTTRAVVSMEKAAREHPGAILAVGNAPTALLKICDLLQGGLRPALVIGVPVGFVNVVESKQHVFALCQKFDVPCIAAMGRKGGSNVAAAICNALLYTAVDALDPERR